MEQTNKPKGKPAFPLESKPDEITQSNELTRSSILIRKTCVLRIVKNLFEEQFEQLKIRSQNDQNVIGNTLTVLESELKKEIKTLKEFTNNG